MFNLFRNRQHQEAKEPSPVELPPELPPDYWTTFKVEEISRLVNDLRGLYSDLLEVKIKLKRDEKGGFEIGKENALAGTEQIAETDESRLQEYHSLIKGLNNLVGEINFIDAKYDGEEMTVEELLQLAKATAEQKREQEKNPKKENTEQSFVN